MNSLYSIQHELFRNNPVIQFKEGIQGQRVIDGIIYVGDQCGPKKNDIASLCHELAHFVEIDEYRMAHSAWGLVYPEVEVFGRMCIEPKTMQSTDRELRVCAYQAYLHEYFKVQESIEETVQALRWMSDTYYVPLEDGSHAYPG